MPSPRIKDFSVSGNLVNDPERVVTPQGKELVTFRLAENLRAKDPQTGEYVDAGANYYDVALDTTNRRLGNLPFNVEQSLRKGHMVTIKGDYRAEAYVTKDGNPGLNHRIWAEDVSPSLKFASVTVEPNQRPTMSNGAQAGAQTNMQHGAQQGQPGFNRPSQQVAPQQQAPAAVPTYTPEDFMAAGPGM